MDPGVLAAITAVVTRPDRYPLLNIRDFTNNLRGCKFFFKLDLVKGYNQVPVSEADICKTAIVTPFGVFIYAVWTEECGSNIPTLNGQDL